MVTAGQAGGVGVPLGGGTAERREQNQRLGRRGSVSGGARQRRGLHRRGERGACQELRQRGFGVKVVGQPNLAGRVATSASNLYARNLFSFIETLVDKSAKALAVKWDDELVKATALTRDGAVIHPNFQPKSA